MGVPSVFGALFTIVFCFTLLAGCKYPRAVNPAPNTLDQQERFAKIRKSIVRIYVDSKPKGTGFIISENGLIATAFHVIAKTLTTPHSQAQITYAASIEVQLDDGERLPAIVHTSCIGKGLHGSILRDYCILEIRTSKQLVPLSLGDFSDVSEGAPVYFSGYPLVSEKPRISYGVVSAKWKDPVVSYYSQSLPEKRNNTDIALLDISMNRGDSGGPIVLMGNKPEEDRVVGIASFVTTPLDQEMKALAGAIKSYTEGRYNIVCTIELFQLLRKEQGDKSLFISGCISIDPLKQRLQKFAREQQGKGTLDKFIPFL
jgi:serine protease Do